MVVGREQGEVHDEQHKRRGDDLGREQPSVHAGLTRDRGGVPIDRSLADDDEKPMREG
jgi:hypothetical protein